MKKAFLKTIVFCLLFTIMACGQNQTKNNMKEMNPSQKKEIISIIGSGNVGGTLGEKWANAGYKVLFSSRNPDQLKNLVNRIGHQSEAVSVEEAAKRGDIIVLAVPFKAEASISKQIDGLIKNKIILNCDNAYPGRDGEVAKEAKAIGVAYYSHQNYFPNVKMIRAFSSAPIANVAMANKNNPINVPYATSDSSINPIAEELIKAADGIPNYVGDLKQGKSLDY